MMHKIAIGLAAAAIATAGSTLSASAFPGGGGGESAIHGGGGAYLTRPALAATATAGAATVVGTNERRTRQTMRQPTLRHAVPGSQRDGDRENSA